MSHKIHIYILSLLILLTCNVGNASSSHSSNNGNGSKAHLPSCYEVIPTQAISPADQFRQYYSSHEFTIPSSPWYSSFNPPRIYSLSPTEFQVDANVWSHLNSNHGSWSIRAQGNFDKLRQRHPKLFTELSQHTFLLAVQDGSSDIWMAIDGSYLLRGELLKRQRLANIPRFDITPRLNQVTSALRQISEYRNLDNPFLKTYLAQLALVQSLSKTLQPQNIKDIISYLKSLNFLNIPAQKQNPTSEQYPAVQDLSPLFVLVSASNLSFLLNQLLIPSQIIKAPLNHEAQLLAMYRHLTGFNGQSDAKLAIAKIRASAKIIPTIQMNQLGSPHPYSNQNTYIVPDPFSNTDALILILGIAKGSPKKLAHFIVFNANPLLRGSDDNSHSPNIYLIPADPKFFGSIKELHLLDIAQASLSHSI